MELMEGVQHFKIPLEEINLVTSNFSHENYIGKGGYGSVYVAQLSLSGEQRTVAIKRLNNSSKQGQREFLMEIQLLSCYRHKNIISLVGFCDESCEKILVYEYAKHGSLEKYLCSSELSWMQRLQISLGAARGLNYLHNDVGPQHRVLHRDIKSSNILLDENWEAKISDFGLSKIGPSNVEFTFLFTRACGTVGYLDPEYLNTGVLTKESVYSFGVVLFEILCGRLARTKYQDQSVFLSSLAPKCYEESRLVEIIHPSLRTQMKVDSLDMFSMVAYQCLKENRTERPTMAWIAEKLEKALELQAGCKVARFIRIGTWGRQGGDPQEYWSFQLEQDTYLSKITIGHGATIYSLTFTSKYKGLVHTSKTVGGGTNGHNVNPEVTSESRSFLNLTSKVRGWASGHKVSEVIFDDDEQIISIDGSIGTRDGCKTISSLSLMTNKRTHGPFGKATKTRFTLPWEEGSLVGFYGLASNYIDSIGVFVKAYEQIIRVGTWGKTQGVGPKNHWSFQLERNHHLKKININHGDLIYSLMFTTEHRGLLQNSRLAGGWKLEETPTEVIFDWDEEIHAINGTVGISRGDDPGCVVITSISFVTNKRIHGPFGNERGKPFTVSWDDCSFVGFYGAAGWYIDKIGVYLKART